ncbi:MAG: hypothetical protein J5614_09520, partial [Paludibacteraceae bacterium]|nr:hypothetical protein [Paludibacteraceae bacterium]
MLTIYKGRPEDLSGRLEREIRVYDLLDSLQIEYDRLDHEPAMTMEVCAEIDAAFERMPLEAFKADQSADKGKHAIICKNLFLTNKQHTKYYLLMMPGDKKFLTKDLSAQINSARLSFAGEEEMLKYLDVTPGSVSVLGLMNDKDHHMYVDHPGAIRNPKIYIDNRDCISDPNKSELDLLKDLYDLSLLT